MSFWCLQFSQKTNLNNSRQLEVNKGFNWSRDLLADRPSLMAADKPCPLLQPSLTWGTIVLKSNFFVHFFGELKILIRHFEINRPLVWSLSRLGRQTLVYLCIPKEFEIIHFVWDLVQKNYLEFLNYILLNLDRLVCD